MFGAAGSVVANWCSSLHIEKEEWLAFFKVKREALHLAQGATATAAVPASDTDGDEWCVMSGKDERLQQQSEKEASEHESHSTLVAVNSHDFPG